MASTAIAERKRQNGHILGGKENASHDKVAGKIGKEGGTKVGRRELNLELPPGLEYLGFELTREERMHFRNIAKMLGGMACHLDSYLIALAARQLNKIQKMGQKTSRVETAVFLALMRDMGMTPASRMKMIRRGINDRLFDLTGGEPGDGFDEL